MEENKDIEIKTESVPIEHLKKLLEKIPDSVEELSFEFVIASCFPTCWNNIQETMKRQYTLGYIQAKKELEKI